MVAPMITPDDRTKYECHTDESILGIKLIAGLLDKTLLEIADGNEVYMTSLTGLMRGANPRWIIAQVAKELYERDLIDEKRLDELIDE